MRVLHPRTSSTAFALCLAIGAVGCGGDPDASHPNPDQEIGCRNDARARSYAPGSELRGERYRFVLVAADPAPPARGQNRWTLQVLDENTPLDDVALEVIPFMPDHDHGPAQLPSVAPTGDRRFTIDAIDFFMPGLWRVTIIATADDVEDSVEFYFCVAG